MLARSKVLPQLLAGLAADDPDAIAMQDVDGRIETRRELHETNLRWADAYRRLGVRAGERVVTMLPNSFEAYHAWLGLCWLGATEVPANTMYRGGCCGTWSRTPAPTLWSSASVTSRNFVRSRPSSPVSRASWCPTLPRSCPTSRGRVVRGDEFFGDAQPVDDFTGPNYWDIAAIIYTSGTTGPSKGVLMPWGTLWSVVDALPDEFVRAGEGFYSTFPPFHMSGKYMLYQAAQRRARLVIREQFSAQHFWDDMRRFEVNGAVLLGAMAPFLMLVPETPDDAGTPLRCVGLVPLPAEVEEFERRFGVRGRDVVRHDRDRNAVRVGRLQSAPTPAAAADWSRAGPATRCRSSTSTTSPPTEPAGRARGPHP